MLGADDREESGNIVEHAREIDALDEFHVAPIEEARCAPSVRPQDNSSNTPKICGLCRGINIAALVALEGYEHAQTADILEDCISNCSICSDIFGKELAQEWAALDKDEDFHIEKGLCLKFERQDCQDKFPGSFLGVYFNRKRFIYKTEVFSLRTPKSKKPCAHIRVLLNDVQDDPAVEYGVISNSENDSASKESFALARDWMDFCKSHHDCSKTLPFLNGIDGMPSMLIDVRKFTADMCLVKAEPNKELSRHVALSHCWGPGGLQKNAMTMLASLSTRMDRIILSSLPLNFKHAVRITRELGIPYLWIDALCIVQDSPDHWDHEVIKMGAIYSNAEVTVAATSSEDSNSGCFNLTNRRLDSALNENEVEIRNDLPNGEQSSITLRIRLNRGNKFYSVYNPLSDSPIAKRAWTFQERILSRRILHYTEDGLIWECSKGYRTIDGIYNPTSSHDNSGFTVNTIARELGLSPSHGDPSYWILGVWYSRVAVTYSKRNLTFLSDKLPAIASIARAVNWQTSSTYLAGIWREKLAWGLAWARSNDWKEPNVGLKPVGDSGPSWSWATHDFGSMWSKPWEEFRVDFTSCISLQDSNIELSGPDPFGRVSSGWLQITGPLKRAFLAIFGPDDDDEWEGDILDKEEGLLIGKARLDYQANSQEVFLMLLLRNDDWQKRDMGWSGYVLILVQDEKSCLDYKRIGLGELGYGPSYLAYLDDCANETIKIS